MDLEIYFPRTRLGNVGIVGRGGYMGPMKMGDDPNPDIDRVGLHPGDLENQLEVGGWIWYVGIKL